jgi:hypothetical protein
MRRLGNWRCVGVGLVALLAGCGVEPLSEEDVAALQQGVTLSRSCEGAVEFPSHAGDEVVSLRAVDATISSHSANDNHGSDPDCMASASAFGGRACVMRFSFPALPAKAKVRSAKLTFSSSHSGALRYQIHALLKDWSESNVTWNSSAVSAWGMPGAKSTKDREGSSMCVFTGETGHITYELNEHALFKIQSWIDGSAANFGFIISPLNPPGSGHVILSSKEGEEALAPELTLVYSERDPQVKTSTAVPSTTIKSKAATTNFSAQKSCVAKRLGNDIEECLLRWDVSSIPPDRKVAAVQILTSKLAAGKGGRYTFYPAKVDWIKQQAIWKNRTTALPWTAPGALSGSDVGAGFSSLIVSGASTFINPEPEAAQQTVQGWVKDPASNKGVLVAPSQLLAMDAQAADIALASLRLQVTYF